MSKEEAVTYRHYAPCKELSAVRNKMIEAKCALECAKNEVEAAKNKTRCDVNNRSEVCSVSEIKTLASKIAELALYLEKEVAEHAQLHPSRGGTKNTDSGYCDSTSGPSDVKNKSGSSEAPTALAELPHAADSGPPSSLMGLQHPGNPNPDRLHDTASESQA